MINHTIFRYYLKFLSIPVIGSLSLVLGCGGAETEPMPVILAKSPQAQVRIDSRENVGSWRIAPEVRPDILPVELGDKGTAVISFYTDSDTLSHTVKTGETFDFVVLLNGKDSAFTRIAAVPPRAVFSPEYIRQNKGKWSVEVPEVQELLLAVFAITPTGLADTRSMIINHDTTEYYQEVLDTFLPFRDHPVVAEMDSLLRNNLFITSKAEACAYRFDASGHIVKSAVYDRMQGGSNMLEPYVASLNDFASQSGFREFYQSHTVFYDSLTAWHNAEISTKKQWEWLEREFPQHTYDHYVITFSPLVKGNHSTVRFNNNGFREAVMFIRPPYRVKGLNAAVSNGLVTRFVFTEIDHNYVNPESDKYIDLIDEYFSDRSEWTNGGESDGYRSPYAIFNEYMTWSVYLLYIYDQYPKKDYEQISDWVVPYVSGRRGFRQFGAFHAALLELYKNRSPGTTVADLYPSLLRWAATCCKAPKATTKSVP